MQVGITGGIGVGKSIVCKILGILGIPVYDADTRARQLMESSPDLRSEITTAFGEDSYTAAGQINRSYLAELVFSNKEKVDQLNSLVHPRVARDYASWVDQHRQKHPYLIKEAALLIESGSYRQLDYLVTVVAPEALRIERVLARDPHRNRDQVQSIISRQLSDAQRIDKSDRILYNDEKQPLLQQVLDLHQFLIKQI